MESTDGMAGVAVVAVSLMLMIIAGYAWSSIDAEQVEVTKFNYITDITGLFGGDSQPQFVPYDPSTNYTQYYMDPATKYFEGVDYVESARVNNYKLNIEPEISIDHEEMDLNDYTITDIYPSVADPDKTVGRISIYINDSSGNALHTYLANHISTVNTVAEGLGLLEDGAIITLDGTASNILFTINDGWKATSYLTTQQEITYYGKPPVDTSTPNPRPPPVNYSPIGFYAEYDVSNEKVTIWWDNTKASQIGIFTPQSVLMCWGPDNINDQIGHVLIVTDFVQEAAYMDPSRGVSLL